MDASVGDDPTKRALFPVLDLSLESLGEEEQCLFLSLVVLALGVSASASMLASLWQKVQFGFLVGLSFRMSTESPLALRKFCRQQIQSLRRAGWRDPPSVLVLSCDLPLGEPCFLFG